MPCKDLEHELIRTVHDTSYVNQRIPKAFRASFHLELCKLKRALDKAATNNESEEHIKKPINTFLSFFYPENQDYTINTYKSVDSVIMYQGKAQVLIEAKRKSNVSEMISSNNINKKALHELVLYYLDETRDTEGFQFQAFPKAGVALHSLMITDGYDWFIFDVRSFEDAVKGLSEDHYHYRAKDTFFSKSCDFYGMVENHFKNSKNLEKLNYIHFSIEMGNGSSARRERLIYKTLSPEYLMRRPYKPQIVPRPLNRRFYSEILYLMGFEEFFSTIEKKPQIRINHECNSSIAAQVYLKLLSDKEYSESKATEETFAMVIVWLDRILFIKLFEGQLASFNRNHTHDDSKLKILSEDKIKSFKDMRSLFFDVLGTQKRDSEFQKSFSEIPYLNSALFEATEKEKANFHIDGLENLPLKVKAGSPLKKHGDTLPLLEYLLKFLASYRFGSIDDTDNNEENGTAVPNQDSVIDASVLGLIFEKINGYKDGAVYTPSGITEFMCKTTIEKVVLQQLNDVFGVNCTSLAELAWNIKSIEDRNKANNIIDHITICDPSVGSGHFLVSALNRILAIKAELGILCVWDQSKRTSKPLGCDVSVVNDILLVTDVNGDAFEYDRDDTASLKVQRSLFKEKQTIISNCLFGVDLNPTAAEICRLRLWIELLKNAYYDSANTMKTLPNIDINIKAGNSLISNMSFSVGKNLLGAVLSEDVQTALNEYKEAVCKYRDSANKAEKNVLNKKAAGIRSQLQSKSSQISFGDYIAGRNITSNQETALDNAFEWAIEFPETISNEGVFLGFDAIIGNPPYIQLQKIRSAAEQYSKVRPKYLTFARTGDIYCLFYELALRLVANDGYVCFVTSNKWMRTAYGTELRKFLANNTSISLLVDFPNQRVFEDVTVDVNILLFCKGKSTDKVPCCNATKSQINNLSSHVIEERLLCAFPSNDSWSIMNPLEQSIKEKIDAVGTPLREWNLQINFGIKTGCNEAFIIDKDVRDCLIKEDPKSAELIRPILRGRDIRKYRAEFAEKYLIATFPSRQYTIEKYPSIENHLRKFGYDRLCQVGKKYFVDGIEFHSRKRTNNKWFETQDSISYWDDFLKPKIVWGEISDEPKFAMDSQGIYFCEATTFLMTGSHLKYILCFLNSAVAKYYFSKCGTTTGVGTIRWKKYKIESFPIPTVSSDLEKKLIDLLEKMLVDDTSASKEIDWLIASAYGLSSEEISSLGITCVDE